MSWFRFLVLPVAVVIVGCRPGAESVTPPEVTPVDAVKKALEQVVESGRGGSEIGAMMNDLEAMKATDPQTAEALIEDAKALMSMSDSAAIKAKAKEMLGKLGSGAPAGEESAEAAPTE
jgi:hypothetical protein